MLSMDRACDDLVLRVSCEVRVRHARQRATTEYDQPFRALLEHYLSLAPKLFINEGASGPTLKRRSRMVTLCSNGGYS